ncbi:hypothetical protein [Micromonospora sp. NPDC005707]|uniref:hypothetical protein n=1 Tax=Micromonospora sp. NPDC005707 TaxID=3157050 RepID=UPI0033F7B516
MATALALRLGPHGNGTKVFADVVVVAAVLAELHPCGAQGVLAVPLDAIPGLPEQLLQQSGEEPSDMDWSWRVAGIQVAFADGLHVGTSP